MSKYTDMFVVIPRVAYEACTAWEKANTHLCAKDEGFAYIQVRLKAETYVSDYLDCPYCYASKEETLLDYPHLAGQEAIEVDGELVTVDKFKTTTWG